MLAIRESQYWLTKVIPALAVTSSNRSSAPAVIGGVTVNAGAAPSDPAGALRITDFLNDAMITNPITTTAPKATAPFQRLGRPFINNLAKKHRLNDALRLNRDASMKMPRGA